MFTFAMCLYAGRILNGAEPGPYREHHARAYARQLLIPAELLERTATQVNVDATAAWLGLPADELRQALTPDTARTPR